MPSLSGLTLTQLRAATVAQIRTAMTNRIGLMTKRQLCILDLWCQSFDADALMTVDDDAVVTTRPDRQVASQMIVQRDVLGAKVGSRQVTWSYFDDKPNAPVRLITTVVQDATDKVLESRVVEHFKDGQQPIESRLV
jgi:hypothetical protein